MVIKQYLSSRFFLFTLALIAYPFAPLGAATFDDSEIFHIDYPGWFQESPFHDLAEDLHRARAAGKQGLMVLFTTEGCSYCEVFIRKSLGDPDLVAILKKHFDTVGMEMFDDSEMTDPRGAYIRVKHFAKREGAGFSPTLLFYGDKGELILRAVGYQSPERFRKILSYLIGERYRSETFRDYLRRQAPPVASAQIRGGLKPDSLFSKPPYALDRRRFPASQPLLVIFEKIDCKGCGVLHDEVLTHSDVRKTLKQFEIVRLDAADSRTRLIKPDGTQTTPTSWYDQTNFTRVPALIFFDEKGNEVLRTDTLVLRQRMMNSLNYVLERAYKKGWTYQRFARSKGIERNREKQLRNER